MSDIINYIGTFALATNIIVLNYRNRFLEVYKDIELNLEVNV